MGARGPTKRPTALTVLKGNPGKRPLNKKEPKPRALPPEMPEWLDEYAQEEWRRLLPELERIPDLVTVVDGTALAQHCLNVSLNRRAVEALQSGLTYEYTNKHGDTNAIAKPEVAIAIKTSALIRSWCAEFGLTPSARTRLQLGGDEPAEDAFEGYLNRGRKT